MTDRELMQMALDALDSMNGTQFLCDAAHHHKKDRHEIGQRCPVAERYKATREAIRARLAQPEPVLVSPKEFIAAVTGKWDISGIPALMSVWPTPEEARPEPEHRDVVIAGDLWRVEFLPDNDANVRLVKANYTTKQEKQEPVAWCIVENGRVHGLVKSKPAVMNAEKWQPLYTALPQREWQGLTDEDIRKLSDDCAGVRDETEFIRAIEAKLKEKNG